MTEITKVEEPKVLDVERARELLKTARDVDTILELRDAAQLAATYAQIRGAGIGSVNDALEIVLRAQRRFGEFLLEHGLGKGRPKKNSPDAAFSLKALGVKQREAKRCRNLAEIDEETFEDHINTVRSKGERLTTSGTIAATSEAKTYDGDSWGTPPEYIALARDVLGEIDLDPASNERAQTVVMAETYLTQAEDGLSQEWRGTVWLNPPYSHPAVEHFVAKLLEEVEAGNVTAAIVLVNNATDTGWCQALLAASAAVCLVKGRIPFLDAEGKPVKGTRQGQLFAYLGPDAGAFETTFADVGAVMRSAG